MEQEHSAFTVTLEFSMAWIAKDGMRKAIEVSEKGGPMHLEKETRARLRIRGLTAAMREGWTPPRWWEFSRWSEYRFTEHELYTAMVNSGLKNRH